MIYVQPANNIKSNSKEKNALVQDISRMLGPIMNNTSGSDSNLNISWQQIKEFQEFQHFKQSKQYQDYQK